MSGEAARRMGSKFTTALPIFAARYFASAISYAGYNAARLTGTPGTLYPTPYDKRPKELTENARRGECRPE